MKRFLLPLILLVAAIGGGFREQFAARMMGSVVASDLRTNLPGSSRV